MVDNIKIGDQNWSNVNLNSNEFRNGEKIEIVKDPNDWFELNKNNKPACCYYNFNESNGQKLGLLYNWFSVIDPRNICPEGWRIPTKEDFEKLILFLGDDSGKHLKSKSIWKKGEKGNGEDSFGFKALPSGFHNQKGKYFDNLKDAAYFWTIDDITENLGEINEVNVGIAASLNFNNHYTFLKKFNKGIGNSIRLIKE